MAVAAAEEEEEEEEGEGWISSSATDHSIYPVHIDTILKRVFPINQEQLVKISRRPPPPPPSSSPSSSIVSFS